MLILGLLMLAGGIAAAIYGNNLNNDVTAQLESMFSDGKANPGDVWLYAGIAVAVVGAILLIARLFKKK